MTTWPGRLLVAALNCVVAFLNSAIYAIGDANHSLVEAALAFLASFGLFAIIMVGAMVLDHLVAPQATRLAGTQDGRMLLTEAARLGARRMHLREISTGPFPIAGIFDELAERDRTDLDAKGMTALLWARHAELERDLRDRQERHLRGETVAIIGRLSDHTP